MSKHKEISHAMEEQDQTSLGDNVNQKDKSLEELMDLITRKIEAHAPREDKSKLIAELIATKYEFVNQKGARISQTNKCSR